MLTTMPEGKKIMEKKEAAIAKTILPRETTTITTIIIIIIIMEMITITDIMETLDTINIIIIIITTTEDIEENGKTKCGTLKNSKIKLLKNGR